MKTLNKKLYNELERRICMKFSDNLRLLRTKHRLSQKEIGDIVGVTSQAISKWENGIAEPDNDSLLKLSNYFNVSTDYLLGKNDVENQSIRYDDELEKVLFSKAKDLTDDEKKTIINVINAIKKDIDKDLDK
ncbi:MAG TPA: helix-turn-helix transcriptional regulator [Candidatus Coprosoma intestinipullorum]|uniref:Helix-turn-helix transcriptional regulator n=1 Tax=Candidatus Coprosoma intestinipullorum TaxID=2840752 RepID=A0A9D0ZQP9_9FIRM|nr:helix-turn-helix transcriptional regulator [Candidatus Coprosoma intestinipullorum]